MSTVDPAFPDEAVAPQDGSSLFGIPLNRIVAFLGPHVSWLSGVVATWLVAHLHFLATFHVGQSQVAKVIANVSVFTVVTAVTWLGHQKWLEGWQVWAYGKLAPEKPSVVPAQISPGWTTLGEQSEQVAPLIGRVGEGEQYGGSDEGGPGALDLNERDFARAVDPATVSDEAEYASPPPDA